MYCGYISSKSSLLSEILNFRSEMKLWISWWPDEVFLRMRSRKAGSVTHGAPCCACSLSTSSLQTPVPGDSLMFYYLPIRRTSCGEDEVVSCGRGWSLNSFCRRFPPQPWAHHYSLVCWGSAQGESPVAPCFSSFEDKTRTSQEKWSSRCKNLYEIL